ncbi:MAG: hypoxanthine phosphoribosyltransferase [Firmicutes bacterium]|nr:hypoxanthine phosphoribosyltransferase [Bacillota bacterium]
MSLPTGDQLNVLLPSSKISTRVQEMGRQITQDYHGEPVLLIGILKGAFIFLADLVRTIDLPLSIDFMAVSSYGASTKHSGVVRILKDLDQGVEGRHVIIVEDIVDTGLTLNYILQYIQSRNAKSVKICALLDKPSRRRVEVPVDYCGFEIPDAFVVGYGLDVDERYRNLPQVYQVQEADES